MYRKNTVVVALAAAMSLCLMHAQTAHASLPDTHAVYAVVHVDIEPLALKNALPYLREFETEAKRDPAVVDIDLLQQTGAENHFTIVEILHSQQAYDTFVSRPYVRTLRARLQPFLGGPFDERVHHVMQ
jgi:quinol monooxygenase YgiN